MVQIIIDCVPDWIQALSIVVASASAIAAATPTPKDDKAVGKLYKLIDMLAVNFGHAKQK